MAGELDITEFGLEEVENHLNANVTTTINETIQTICEELDAKIKEHFDNELKAVYEKKIKEIIKKYSNTDDKKNTFLMSHLKRQKPRYHLTETINPKTGGRRKTKKRISRKYRRTSKQKQRGGGGFLQLLATEAADTTKKMITGYLNIYHLDSVIQDGFYRSTYELPLPKESNLLEKHIISMFDQYNEWKEAILDSRCGSIVKKLYDFELRHN